MSGMKRVQASLETHLDQVEQELRHVNARPGQQCVPNAKTSERDAVKRVRASAQWGGVSASAVVWYVALAGSEGIRGGCLQRHRPSWLRWR